MIFSSKILNSVLFLLVLISIIILTGIQITLSEPFSDDLKEINELVQDVNINPNYKNYFNKNCEDMHIKFINNVDKHLHMENRINNMEKLSDFFNNEIRRELLKEDGYPKNMDDEKWKEQRTNKINIQLKKLIHKNPACYDKKSMETFNLK